MFGPGAGRQRPSCLSTSALVEAGWGGWWAWVALVCHLLAPHEPAAFLRGALPVSSCDFAPGPLLLHMTWRGDLPTGVDEVGWASVRTPRSGPLTPPSSS